MTIDAWFATARKHLNAGRLKEGIPLAEPHLERLGEQENHLAARPSAPRFHVAQVPRRHAGEQREGELAHPTGAPPIVEQGAEGILFPRPRSDRA